jgi:hypothetical protein
LEEPTLGGAVEGGGPFVEQPTGSPSDGGRCYGWLGSALVVARHQQIAALALPHPRHGGEELSK